MIDNRGDQWDWERFMNRAYTLSCFVALLLASVGTSFAQVVAGTLAEQGSGDPIAGATVTLLDAAGARRVSTVTDSIGAFEMRSETTTGTFRVRVEHARFATIETGSFAFTSARPIVMNLATRDRVVVMGEVSTERLNAAGFESRRARRLGFAIGPDEVAARIARYKPEETGDLVERLLPGMEVSDRTGALLIPRRAGGSGCIPTMVVDGKRYDPPLTAFRLGADGAGTHVWDINDLVPVWEIRAIEIYQSPRFVPMELNLKFLGMDGRAPCGVIVVWTYRAFDDGSSGSSPSPTRLNFRIDRA